MKIKDLVLKEFKRFTDLHVTDIPESAKLVVLVGPNGSGKTSFFEALNYWYRFKAFGNIGEKLYIDKLFSIDNGNWYNNKVEINFHERTDIDQEKLRGKFYFRTAYRNEPDFTIHQLSQQNNPQENYRLETLMHNDQTVSENYQRLVAQTLAGVYEGSNDEKTVEELRSELIGRIQKSLSSIFDDLNLSSIGNPLSNGSFFFTKGTSEDFHYKNLSAGEKSVFDIVLDLIIKSSYYSDSIFCIDEPEAHMHTRLQSKVLREIFSLTPSNSQLWVSTHSIGMLKEAEKLEKENPGSVVFLDFDNRDFDLSEKISPSKIGKAIWDRFYDLAFADFSQLVAPNRIVFCEGTSNGRKYKDFDAQIYSIIFSNEFHDTKFISIGSCSELEKEDNKSISIASKILGSVEVIKFIDRDDKSNKEVDELKKNGINSSKRRHLECYLFDDEIIKLLCIHNEKEELIQECLEAKANAIADSVSRGNPEDDIKSASGKMFTDIKRILMLRQCGNNKCAFVRDTLAPLVTEDTDVYKQLKAEIFGEDA